MPCDVNMFLSRLGGVIISQDDASHIILIDLLCASIGNIVRSRFVYGTMLCIISSR